MDKIIDKNIKFYEDSIKNINFSQKGKIRYNLFNYGMVILDSNIDIKILSNLNNKIIHFLNNNISSEIKIYNKEQKNRLKTNIVKNSKLYKEIEEIFSSVLDKLSKEFNKKINILKINSDIALPNSNLQYPHWDNEHNEKKVFLTIPLVDMDSKNGSIEIWPATQGVDNYIDKKLNNVKYSLSNIQFRETFQELIDIEKKIKSYLGPFLKSQILLRDNSTLHRGTVNKSDKVRVTLTIVLDL